MVILDGHLFWPCALPAEYNPPLVIHSDTKRPFPISIESLQAITRRYAKGVKRDSSVELVELLVRRLVDPRIQFRNWFTQKYQFCLSVPE
ncbi:hypothetical protein HMPREF2990_05750 [Corynebacterium sp. HMSC071B10]|nr:hypothetical protein HMPREF2990_05750 [Corynebacterium sp. HMSC071B10]